MQRDSKDILKISFFPETSMKNHASVFLQHFLLLIKSSKCLYASLRRKKLYNSGLDSYLGI